MPSTPARRKKRKKHMAASADALEVAFSHECDHADPTPVERFDKLRSEITLLLNRSFWDQDAYHQIRVDLYLKCQKMALLCADEERIFERE